MGRFLFHWPIPKNVGIGRRLVCMFVSTYNLVMQRFGNLKVSSVFGFLHPETAVSVYFIFFKPKTDTAVSVV